MWNIVFTKQAQKDAMKISRAALKKKVESLLEILSENPPSHEKPIGDLAGTFSRRINIQHRLVYQIFDETQTVKIIRMWTHYE